MEQEFNSFDEKLAHSIALFKRLRAENNELRQTIAAKSDEINRVNEKLDMAKTRIDALLQQVPEVQDDDFMSDNRGITINVMGREFRVAAPVGKEPQLSASVDFLNKKMKEIRDAGKVTGNERIAIMAALNIAHDFLALQSNPPPVKTLADGVDIKRKIASYEAMIEKAIADQEKLF